MPYTYVGFGFGAIQPGLLLYEAFRSRAFGRYVVAEILPELVAAMRQADGMVMFNLAGMDGVRQVTLGPVELLDVGVAANRETLIAAIADAHEIGSAITTFNQYVMDIPGSEHVMLAEGLRRKVAEDKTPAVVYAAENNNHAAEMLEAAVMDAVPAAERDAVGQRVQFVNTVVSKMCGLVTEPEMMAQHGLVPMWENGPRALLVEDYALLLINQIHLPNFTRGISLFEEKDDLLPFKEAKLFGHNGTHAIAAYLGGLRGATRITDLQAMPDLIAFLRAAFVEEVGAALIRKYADFDPLFTPDGFAAFVDGILPRMVNPHLLDTVARVGRDPRRKLGWDDRLVGALRLCLAHNVEPRRYAFGTAAAVVALDPAAWEDDATVRSALTMLWKLIHPDPAMQTAVLDVIWDGLARLRQWRADNFGTLPD